MRIRAQIIVALLLSSASSIALIVVYARGGQPQLEGLFLGLALGGIGWALVVGAHTLLDEGEATQQRLTLESTPEERSQLGRDLERPVTRRRLLVAMLGAALASLAAALLVPIQSLARVRDEELGRSRWREGIPLVDESGRPIHVGTLPIGGAITAFPEGEIAHANSVLMLVRVAPERLALPESRQDWAPEGYLAYSKICTHAGCPVGLFDGSSGLLTCPCHQSAFQTVSGANPVARPTARPLPQLPLVVDDEGNLVAGGEMSDPVGPGFWDQPRT